MSTEQLQQKIENLESKLATSEAKLELSTGLLNKYRSGFEMTQAENARLREEPTVISRDLVNQVQALKAENARLNAEVEGYQRAHRELLADRARLRAELADERSVFEQQNEIIGKYEAENAKLKQAIKDGNIKWEALERDFYLRFQQAEAENERLREACIASLHYFQGRSNTDGLKRVVEQLEQALKPKPEESR